MMGELLSLEGTLLKAEQQQRRHEKDGRTIELAAAEATFGSNRAQKMLTLMEQNYYAVHWKLAVKVLRRRIRRLEKRLPSHRTCKAVGGKNCVALAPPEVSWRTETLEINSDGPESPHSPILESAPPPTPTEWSIRTSVNYNTGG